MTDLMLIASADPFKIVARNHRLQHEDAECVGSDFESREERSDRLYREHTESLLVESAEKVAAQEARFDAEDRAWRETHPQEPSAEALQQAREYMARAIAQREGSR
jgi:hypothetical protein